MGEYSTLYVAGYEIDSWKNCIGPEAAMLFTEDDIVETPRPYYGGEVDEDGEDEEDESFPGYQYRSTARNIIDRLEVIGYTLDRTRKVFEAGKAETIEESKRFTQGGVPEELRAAWIAPPYAPHEVTIEFYKNYTFEVWSQLIRDVIVNKQRRVYNPEDKELLNHYALKVHRLLIRTFVRTESECE